MHVPDLPDPLPEALTVLDVREQVEWDHGHIDGAVHVPLHDLPSRLDLLPVLVGRNGHQQAVAYLSALGHPAVNLAGGMVDWAQAGLADGQRSTRCPRSSRESSRQRHLERLGKPVEVRTSARP